MIEQDQIKINLMSFVKLFFLFVPDHPHDEQIGSFVGRHILGRDSLLFGSHVVLPFRSSYRRT